MNSSGNAHKSSGSLERHDSDKRPRPSFAGASIVCLIEGCGADLSGSKDYHQRHKVCEVHARAASALHKGQLMRFCQQCSRFHPVAEFDEGKRSCRRRLLGHNKRRRKKEDPASEPDDHPAPHRPHFNMATSALPYDAHEEVRRRKGAAAPEHTPPRRLGQGLSLSPFSPHEAAPASDGPSLSQFLRDSGVAPRAPDGSLSSLLMGAPPQQTADFLGRTLGLSASQQLLLGFQPQRSANQELKPEARNTLQLHFPPSSATSLLPAAGARQSPSLQQLLDKSAGGHSLSSPGRHATAGGEASSLFPLPNSLEAGGSPWAGQLEGLVGGQRGGGLNHNSAPYLPQDRTGRISFKLFDKNPNDLPDDLRDQILDWLQRRPSAMETYLRPGCVHVSAYLAMPHPDWDALERDLLPLLAGLVRSQAWAGGTFTAFTTSMEAHVEQGVVQRVCPLTPAQGPVLLSVHPRCLVAGQPVEMTVTGRGLLHANNRLVCLHNGQRFLDSRPSAAPARPGTSSGRGLPVSWSHDDDAPLAPSPPRCGGQEWSPRVGAGPVGPSSWSADPVTGVETLVWTMAGPPPEARGSMFLEVDRGGCPSNMKPLLVADAALAAELAQLDAQLHSSGPPDSAARRAAESSADALVADLGWALGGQRKEGKSARLAAWARERGWRHTAERIRGSGGPAEVPSGERAAFSGKAARRAASAAMGVPGVPGQAAPDNMTLNGTRKENLGALHSSVKQGTREQGAAGKPSPVWQQVVRQAPGGGGQLGSKGGQQVPVGFGCTIGTGPWQGEAGAARRLVTAVYSAAISRTRVCLSEREPAQTVCSLVWGPVCV
ncbi:hypothetical protein KFL_009790030 [Klebsormidium nitens]|uniref:SBP-type domain-containing protein n=1 Tax=Klebsormidium nitens TaxID=105231 RepID=A0A1Y1ISR5_KLENI|nr:hypothetical protein KFL_009790030 [Klebsormidium nitens]|eukprot:GAQ92321.1 hypothetical protein KFL_009790030 [Klebsormidium nitens]